MKKDFILTSIVIVSILCAAFCGMWSLFTFAFVLDHKAFYLLNDSLVLFVSAFVLAFVAFIVNKFFKLNIF